MSDYRLQADFYYVYIREAHPKEGWSIEANGKWDVHEPTSLEERKALGQDWHGETGCKAPLLVDGIENATDFAFGAKPERLYILQNNKVVYRGGMGPFWYDPQDMEAKLTKLLGGAE